MTDEQSELDARIRAAYTELKGEYSHVKLADLRERVGASRQDMDQALSRISYRYGAHVRAEADQKTLTERDRAAAVELGGTARHLLYLEECYGQEPLIFESVATNWDLPRSNYQPRHAAPEPDSTAPTTETRSAATAMDQQPRHSRPDAGTASEIARTTTAFGRAAAHSRSTGRHRRH